MLLDYSYELDRALSIGNIIFKISIKYSNESLLSFKLYGAKGGALKYINGYMTVEG